MTFRAIHRSTLAVAAAVIAGVILGTPDVSAQNAKEKGLEYTEKLYRELYFRDGGKRPRRPRITVIEISIV